MKESNFVSAVIYIRNSAKTIINTLQVMSALFDTGFQKYEIICIDDSSEDDTTSKVRLFAKEHEDVSLTLISTGFYQGVERAMNAGVDFAIGDFVFQFDSDVIDYELPLIMNVYNRCLQGFDIVSAVPDKKARTSSKLFYSLFNKYSQTQYPLASDRFRIISRRGINRVGQMSNSVFYRKVLYANCGLKADIVKYSAKPGKKNSFAKHERTFRRELAIDSFVLFTDLAAKISMAMCSIMLLVTLASGIYTVVIFVIGQPVFGWTTTMLLLSVGLFGIFAVLTLAIKYLSLVLKLVFERQKYVIENVEKL